MEWLPISYGEFWDLPRMLLVRVDDRLLFLDCEFDATLDEYPDHYIVYELPADHYGFHEGDWSELPSSAIEIGRLGLDQVEFDSTKREALKSSELESLVKRTFARPESGDIPNT